MNWYIDYWNWKFSILKEILFLIENNIFLTVLVISFILIILFRRK